VPARSLILGRHLVKAAALLIPAWACLVFSAAFSDVGALLALPATVAVIAVVATAARLQVYAVHDVATDHVTVHGVGVALPGHDSQPPQRPPGNPRPVDASPSLPAAAVWAWGLLTAVPAVSWLYQCAALARQPSAYLHHHSIPLAGLPYFLLIGPVVAVDIADAIRRQPSCTSRTTWALALLLLNAPASVVYWARHIRPRAAGGPKATT